MQLLEVSGVVQHIYIYIYIYISLCGKGLSTGRTSPTSIHRITNTLKGKPQGIIRTLLIPETVAG
jgi:hypothetical protein